MRIAINGFGRIGKTFLRVLLESGSKGIEVVAINVGTLDPELVAHTFKYDTTMGKFKEDVVVAGRVLIIGSHKIMLFAETSAESLPWQQQAIDWVVDCTGRYTKAEDAYQHIRAGAKKVLISAPASGVDCTIIPGVNDHLYDSASHHIVSLGSCTSNALLPMLKIIHDVCGIKRAFVVTTHAYTNAQSLLDGGPSSCSDVRKYRAAPLNMIPASTGADRVIGEVLPALAGRVSALAIRVPVSNVSLLEVTWSSERIVSLERLLEAFDTACQKGPLRNIVSATDAQLVSSDYLQHPASVIVDKLLCSVQDDMGTAFGWYDNEWGYSCRLRDFLLSAQ